MAKDLEMANKIKTASGFGLNEDQICELFGMTKQHLKRNYAMEMSVGAAYVIFSVTQQLLRDATSQTYIRRIDSQKLILTNLHGWSEKSSTKLAGDKENPITFGAAPLDPKLLEALEALKPKAP